jgi:hypothetical protein
MAMAEPMQAMIKAARASWAALRASAAVSSGSSIFPLAK